MNKGETSLERFTRAMIATAVACGKSRYDAEIIVPIYWTAVKAFPINDILEYLLWWTTSADHGETHLFKANEFARRVRSHAYKPQHVPSGDPCENCHGFEHCKNIDGVYGVPKCRTPGAIAARIDFMKMIAEMRYNTGSNKFISLSEALYGEFVGRPYERMKAKEKNH